MSRRSASGPARRRPDMGHATAHGAQRRIRARDRRQKLHPGRRRHHGALDRMGVWRNLCGRSPSSRRARLPHILGNLRAGISFRPHEQLNEK